MNPSPTLWKISLYNSLICFPRIASKKYINRCPPSSIGIGNRFIRPILTDNSAVRCNKGSMPFCAISPEIEQYELDRLDFQRILSL